jgi:hypothetical protein
MRKKSFFTNYFFFCPDIVLFLKVLFVTVCYYNLWMLLYIGRIIFRTRHALHVQYLVATTSPILRNPPRDTHFNIIGFQKMVKLSKLTLSQQRMWALIVSLSWCVVLVGGVLHLPVLNTTIAGTDTGCKHATDYVTTSHVR